MGFITMWKHGARRCVFIVGGAQRILRLVDATTVLREQAVSADAAAPLARLWEMEDCPAALPGSPAVAFA
jgi:hypothetical protein